MPGDNPIQDDVLSKDRPSSCPPMLSSGDECVSLQFVNRRSSSSAHSLFSPQPHVLPLSSTPSFLAVDVLCVLRYSPNTLDLTRLWIDRGFIKTLQEMCPQGTRIVFFVTPNFFEHFEPQALVLAETYLDEQCYELIENPLETLTEQLGCEVAALKILCADGQSGDLFSSLPAQQLMILEQQVGHLHPEHHQRFLQRVEPGVPFILCLDIDDTLLYLGKSIRFKQLSLNSHVLQLLRELKEKGYQFNICFVTARLDFDQSLKNVTDYIESASCDKPNERAEEAASSLSSTMHVVKRRPIDDFYDELKGLADKASSSSQSTNCVFDALKSECPFIELVDLYRMRWYIVDPTTGEPQLISMPKADFLEELGEETGQLHVLVDNSTYELSAFEKRSYEHVIPIQCFDKADFSPSQQVQLPEWLKDRSSTLSCSLSS